MSADNEPKATRRHEKIARSRKAEIEDMDAKINMEQSALKRYKSDRTAQMWDLEPADRAAFKAETKAEIQKRKGSIADLKMERRRKKGEYRAEQMAKKMEALEREEAAEKKKKEKNE